MEDSSGRQMKRQRLEDDPVEYIIDRESKRRMILDAPNDGRSPLCEQDAAPAFEEAFAYKEDMPVFCFEGCDGMDELQHNLHHYEITNEASEDISCESEDSSLEIVCFGTVGPLRRRALRIVLTNHLTEQITSIHGRCTRSRSCPQKFQVTLTSSERFKATDDKQLTGIIPPQYGHMVKSMLDEKALTLFTYCSIDTDVSQKHPSNPYSQIPCTLDVTIYGSNDLFETIGRWLQDYDVYLQDPRTSDLDVKYRNPHRLSSTEYSSCPSVSMVVWLGTDIVQFQNIDKQPELLDVISGQDDLEETAAPKMIRTNLHQYGFHQIRVLDTHILF